MANYNKTNKVILSTKFISIDTLKKIYWKFNTNKSNLYHFMHIFVILTLKSWIELFTLRLTTKKRLLAISLIEHMGDIVASQPVAEYVKRTYPDHAVVWVTRPSYKKLVSEIMDVDYVCGVECITHWILIWKSGVFDEVFDLHMNMQECPCCGIRINKNPNTINYSNYYLEHNLLEARCILSGLPILSDAPVFKASKSAASIINELDLPSKYIVVHCKSNDKRRDWTLDNWGRLVDIVLSNHNITVVELGLSHLVHCNSDRYLDFCGKLSILESAEIIRRATLFVGIESGLAHIANAMCTPGLILVGEYSGFNKYMPYSGYYKDNAVDTILYANGPASNHNVDDVYMAIKKKI